MYWGERRRQKWFALLLHKIWIWNMYWGGRKLQRGIISILNKSWMRNIYWGRRRLQSRISSVLNKNWIWNMYWGGRKLQKGFTLIFNQEWRLQSGFSSVLNKNWIRNMYWGGRKLQKGFRLILSQELNKENVLGRKCDQERILIEIWCDILSSLIASDQKAQQFLKVKWFHLFLFGNWKAFKRTRFLLRFISEAEEIKVRVVPVVLTVRRWKTL